MLLKFTPLIISELEDLNDGRSYSTLLSNIQIKNLALFVMKGMSLPDLQTAFTEIGNYFDNENGDIQTLMLMITKSLQKDGFLPREVNVDEEVKKATENLPMYVTPQTNNLSM